MECGKRPWCGSIWGEYSPSVGVKQDRLERHELEYSGDGIMEKQCVSAIWWIRRCQLVEMIQGKPKAIGIEYGAGKQEPPVLLSKRQVEFYRVIGIRSARKYVEEGDISNPFPWVSQMSRYHQVNGAAEHR